jgi:fumarate hydratase class I
MSVSITEDEIISSLTDALQYISYYHPADYVQSLVRSYEVETSPAAKEAIRQLLVNSRLAAFGRRPICQDTGVVHIFASLGAGVQLQTSQSLQSLVDEAIRRAWRASDNPLRASMVEDPLFSRKNTTDNTPGILYVDVVPGDKLTFDVVAKGAGSENKAQLRALLPHESLPDWVVSTVEKMGAGWCPPGIMGVGVGGSADRTMLLAKKSLLEPINMAELLAAGPSDKLEELRIELYERINALGIGAQGFGGMTTVLDVKVLASPTHAASKLVGLIPQCAADRHARIVLDGQGTVALRPPDLALWPAEFGDASPASGERVDLATLTPEQASAWRAGDRLLLSGKLVVARDAAHRRIAEIVAAGGTLPVELKGRAIYYAGPIEAVGGEVVGPAGPTTASRMDGYLELMLGQLGVLLTIGKAERGPEAIERHRRYGRAYLAAVGGAALLISRSVRSARILAFEDLGMEAIREFEVVDMPVLVAIDASGGTVYERGRRAFARELHPTA